jgi:RimJ/RimL family protein N-acetyltransferase
MALLPDTLAAPPLELRRCRPDHLDALMSALASSQPELARFLPWADPMPTTEAERTFIEQSMAEFETGVAYGFFLFERSGGELVGGAGLVPTEAPGRFQIGYWVRSDRTGRGYATAAARALTTAALEQLGLDEIEIRMDQANLASASVPPKLGFQLDRVMERDITAAGHSGAGYVWMMSRARWLDERRIAGRG